MVHGASGASITDYMFMGCLKVLFVLAEENAVAASATDWLGHKWPLVVAPSPSLQLLQVAGLELLRGKHPISAKSFLHLSLVSSGR
jgi:hypothetical protein